MIRQSLSKGMQTFCVDEDIDERKVCLWDLLQSAFWDKRQLNFIVIAYYGLYASVQILL